MSAIKRFLEDCGERIDTLCETVTQSEAIERVALQAHIETTGKHPSADELAELRHMLADFYVRCWSKATPARPQPVKQNRTHCFSLRFARCARRIHKDFSNGVLTRDMEKCLRALINATRLWNLADHRDSDSEMLWRRLNAYCGEWFLTIPGITNSARFTYVNSDPFVQVANVADAVTDFAMCYPVSTD